MRLFKITIPAGKTVNQGVSPARNLYLDKLSASGSLDIDLYGADQNLVASLDNLTAGSSYKSGDSGSEFTMMRLRNNAGDDNIIALYVGRDEFTTAKISLGGSVATDSAAAASLFTGRQSLTRTAAVNLLSLLPSGAVVSDWAFKVTKGKVKMSHTATGDGMVFDLGQGMSGSNSYPLWLRADSIIAEAEIVVSYKA